MIFEKVDHYEFLNDFLGKLKEMTEESFYETTEFIMGKRVGSTRTLVTLCNRKYDNHRKRFYS